ncbi:SH3 domain-containing protein [Clostridium algidicarnis]|uniref:SH3 domain-containing protein n=1 Tax=Clostridium algidicarnis TaxID=37659 RepID=A0ABS6C4E7_9CLOT|nr:SH3 domain-containing protein [Clostridium algidicarnis]MBU3220365.1 SH3 domain-containing protein [Clostridium algidicarnis]
MRRSRRRVKTKSRFKLFLLAVLIMCSLVFTLYYILSGGFNAELNPNKSDNNSESESPSDSDVPVIPKEPTPSENFIDYLQEVGTLELPVNGASGYATVSLKLREGPSIETNIISTLESGQGFTILEEFNDWWQIEVDGKIGWVMHQYCLVNLPDIIPSIIYDNTNSYSSKMVSSGKEIPNITGKMLYNTYMYNERFGEEEYVVPVLYMMASKISLAQQAALADGNTLIIYEAFRPYEAQQKIVENLRVLADTDPEVKEGISKSPWSIGWFISTGTSNHQSGFAIDVSLGKVISQEKKTTGSYIYKKINEYVEYSMPTEIHELSTSSRIFNSPLSSKSNTEWRNAIPSETMNNEALLLQEYCTKAGLTPLASEWWHFNDLDGLEVVKNNGNSGRFFIQNTYSVAPISKEKSK